MKLSHLIKSVLFTFFYIFVSSTTVADSWTGHVSAYIGQKTLSGDNNSEANDWDKFDKQGSFGIAGDLKKESWPVSLTLATFVSGDVEKYTGDNKQELGIMELQLGIQKYFNIEGSAIKPYVGLGVVYVAAEMRNTVDSVETKDDDTKAGPWAGAGFIVDINQHFDVGLDVRYSDVNLTIFDAEHGAGGLTASVRAGYHF